MKFPIGFQPEGVQPDTPAPPAEGQEAAPAKESVVLVRFPTCHIPLSYYNDRFDLRPGDIVFVEGKYQGVAGRVEKVSTSFRIRLEDYKKVVGVADTRVRGAFRQAGGHLITFDRAVLPYRQALSWFRPVPEEDGFYVHYGDAGFPLNELGAWPFSPEIMERGVDYYGENKVVYLCLDGGKGRALVEGSRAYEVEFTLTEGRISDLVCDCPCGYHCKHEAAALLQLRETLAVIGGRYSDALRESLYFAAVSKPVFLSFAMDGDADVTLTLS